MAENMYCQLNKIYAIAGIEKLDYALDDGNFFNKIGDYGGELDDKKEVDRYMKLVDDYRESIQHSIVPTPLKEKIADCMETIKKVGALDEFGEVVKVITGNLEFGNKVSGVSIGNMIKSGILNLQEGDYDDIDFSLVPLKEVVKAYKKIVALFPETKSKEGAFSDFLIIFEVYMHSYGNGKTDIEIFADIVTLIGSVCYYKGINELYWKGLSGNRIDLDSPVFSEYEKEIETFIDYIKYQHENAKVFDIAHMCMTLSVLFSGPALLRNIFDSLSSSSTGDIAGWYGDYLNDGKNVNLADVNSDFAALMIYKKINDGIDPLDAVMQTMEYMSDDNNKFESSIDEIGEEFFEWNDFKDACLEAGLITQQEYNDITNISFLELIDIIVSLII